MNDTLTSELEQPAGFAPSRVGLPLRDISKEIDSLTNELDKHHRLAADVRELLHNGGAGPKPSRLTRADKILMEIAGLPTEQPNDASS